MIIVVGRCIHCGHKIEMDFAHESPENDLCPACYKVWNNRDNVVLKGNDYDDVDVESMTPAELKQFLNDIKEGKI